MTDIGCRLFVLFIICAIQHGSGVVPGPAFYGNGPVYSQM
jgi:hypothetical protein